MGRYTGLYSTQFHWLFGTVSIKQFKSTFKMNTRLHIVVSFPLLQTPCSMPVTRVKERHQHIRMSVVAEHSILLHDIKILADDSKCMDCVISKSLATGLHPNTINRKDSFFMSRSWKPDGMRGFRSICPNFDFLCSWP
jgi:hypothetical protein